MRFGVTTLLVVSVAAQSSAEAVRYTCSYTSFAEPSGLSRAKSFQMEFAYDRLTGDAFIFGNAGVSEVQVYEGTKGITFLEYLGSGAVQVTIIDRSGVSAHSRHTIIGSDLVPSQYYGNCIVN